MKIDLSKIDNMDFDGLNFDDYPDFADLTLCSADYDGKEMTEDQIDYVNENHYEFVYDSAYSSLY